ncbi:MAG: GNAT family N-acetyltransferase [Bacteroides sp.]|nr:GNAT family N-acetyltransferase [Bacteroides sp.]
MGYVTFFFARYTWSGKALYMDDLYIRPTFRGKGLGTKLIDKVIQYAKENNCHKLRWQVSDWNEPAIRFYKNLGANIDTVERNCDLLLE